MIDILVMITTFGFIQLLKNNGYYNEGLTSLQKENTYQKVKSQHLNLLVDGKIADISQTEILVFAEPNNIHVYLKYPDNYVKRYIEDAVKYNKGQDVILILRDYYYSQNNFLFSGTWFNNEIENRQDEISILLDRECEERKKARKEEKKRHEIANREKERIEEAKLIEEDKKNHKNAVVSGWLGVFPGFAIGAISGVLLGFVLSIGACVFTGNQNKIKFENYGLIILGIVGGIIGYNYNFSDKRRK